MGPKKKDNADQEISAHPGRFWSRPRSAPSNLQIYRCDACIGCSCEVARYSGPIIPSEPRLINVSDVALD